MKGNMEERAVYLAEYIIEHDTTVRKVAEMFAISKSTIHVDVLIQNVFGWCEINDVDFYFSLFYNRGKDGCDFMAQVNISIDEQLKNQADILFQKLGLNFSSAVNLLVTQAVEEGCVSFSANHEQSDEALLIQPIKEQAEGKVIAKTMEELRAMEE